jgi:GT2 family glycosyltransferase
MIYYSIPYSLDKNIGNYYNSVMESIPNDDDFACFVDGDTIFTTNNFGTQIASAIQRYPECKFFTCYTNRISSTTQNLPNVDKNNNDVHYHRILGKNLQEKYWDECFNIGNDMKDAISGVLMLIRKDLWKAVGGFQTEGMLGVDNNFHIKCIQIGEPVYIMRGVYIYHWYRWPDYTNKLHLI